MVSDIDEQQLTDFKPLTDKAVPFLQHIIFLDLFLFAD